MRLFVALCPPDGIRSHLESAMERLRPRIPRGPVRIVPPDQWHVTLRFLGEVASTPPVLGRLDDALREATTGVPGFSLRLDGFGCFPSTQRPRVLWAGLSGEIADLARLQARVARAAEAFNSARDEHPFHPHLTLARVRDACRPDAEAIRRALERTELPRSEPWRTTEIRLMESQLGPDGPQYRVRSVFPLAEGEARTDPPVPDGRNTPPSAAAFPESPS